MEETLLTVDTCSRAGSVAVSRGERLLGEIFLCSSANHTQHLLTTLRTLLKEVDIPLSAVDAFGVVLGPGSFTGLRVGVATVKGLAMALNRPVVGLSSLRVLAMQAPFASHQVCALLDARKKEVYAGLFSWETGMPSALGEERVIPPEELLSSLEGEILFIGDGAEAYRTFIVRRLGERARFVPWSQNAPRAGHAAVLALEDLRQGMTILPTHLAPRYIRPSEAEIMWSLRQSEPLIEG